MDISPYRHTLGSDTVFVTSTALSGTFSYYDHACIHYTIPEVTSSTSPSFIYVYKVKGV